MSSSGAGVSELLQSVLLVIIAAQALDFGLHFINTDGFEITGAWLSAESLEKASLRACSGGNISEGQKGQEKSRLGEQHYGGTKWMIRGTGGELNCQVRGAVQKRLTKTSLMLENGLGVRKE